MGKVHVGFQSAVSGGKCHSNTCIRPRAVQSEVLFSKGENAGEEARFLNNDSSGSGGDKVSDEDIQCHPCGTGDDEGDV